MKNKLLFALFGSLSVVVLILLLNMSQVRGANLPLQRTPAGVLAAQVQALQSSLQQVEDPQEKIVLQEKLEAQQFALNVQAAAQAQPTLSLEAVCANRVPVPQQTTLMEQGVLLVREDFLVPQGLKISNMFRGEMNGTVVEVYAGSVLDDPNQGLVILAIDSLGVWLKVLSPTAAGSLRIIEANELRLSLQTAAGDDARYFDIPAQQFVESLDQVVPAVELPVAKEVFADPCLGK